MSHFRNVLVRPLGSRQKCPGAWTLPRQPISWVRLAEEQILLCLTSAGAMQIGVGQREEKKERRRERREKGDV